ncbi:MAG: hypothetical protein NT006_04235 [Candidatus Aminicenantes bacterium]|nr:hypothetical protein [Candidatus Aminicenantes bacterium]
MVEYIMNNKKKAGAIRILFKKNVVLMLDLLLVQVRAWRGED